jgi:RNA polymerase sigma factor (sigma-70 family)
MVTDGRTAADAPPAVGVHTGRDEVDGREATALAPSLPAPTRDPDERAAAPTGHLLADTAAEVFRSWCAGDEGAGGELVDLLTPVLWHTARAYRIDVATAEDVVQSAWLALARRRAQIKDPQAVMAWLLVTVRRDAARAATRSRIVGVDPEPLLAARPDTAPGPAATVLDEDRARRLWAAVSLLSERCQRLLRVIAFSDRPDYASLSVDLGMPVGSIGPTRGRCLKKLRESIAGQEQWSS